MVFADPQTYTLAVISPITTIEAGAPNRVVYKITDTTGKVLRDFETVHDRLMHLIVVRMDLESFQHLHPVFNSGTGEFDVDIVFPADGEYRLIADFTLAQDGNSLQKLAVVTTANLTVGNLERYQPRPVAVDTVAVKRVGDYEVSFIFPQKMHPHTPLDYSLTIHKNGPPVTDLEPYLGALGHSVILKEGTLHFIHTHPKEKQHNRDSGENMHHEHDMHSMATSTGGGPTITFSAQFPEEGVYKVFTQFQHQGIPVIVLEITDMD
jgi:hypothetical protein